MSPEREAIQQADLQEIAPTRCPHPGCDGTVGGDICSESGSPLCPNCGKKHGNPPPFDAICCADCEAFLKKYFPSAWKKATSLARDKIRQDFAHAGKAHLGPLTICYSHGKGRRDAGESRARHSDLVEVIS